MVDPPLPALPAPGQPLGPAPLPAAAASNPEIAAMRTALELAATPGVPLAPNPRVGCVILAGTGGVLGTGHHQGAGTAHAEVAALEAVRAAGFADLLPGATAVVTLEPCNHTGRTGPCSRALIAAGIARVVFAQPDPNPVAAGGASSLLAAGVEVVSGLLADEAAAINEEWTFTVTHGRPMVTWKVASTLDGRICARDGTSRWITSAQARAEVHRLRERVQAIIVGTGTALADDPSLTVRDADGTLRGEQPWRVVVGRRALPEGARVADAAAPLLRYTGEDLAGMLADLGARGVCHALLEGGPTLAASFVAGGLVDRIRWYVAPALLGAGRSAIADLGIVGIGDARRLRIRGMSQVGPDVAMDIEPL